MTETTNVRRNVFVLAVCQALFQSTNTIMLALSGLVGFELASDKSLATLPVTCSVFGTMLATIPASLLMRRIGRVRGFRVGALFGLAGCTGASLGIYLGNFALFSASCFMFGTYSAFSAYYRFAAADVATAEFRSRAISLVMAGAVVAGFLGPELAKHTRTLIAEHNFLATYITGAVLTLLTMATLSTLTIPHVPIPESAGTGRPMLQIIRQPVYLVAALSGAIGFGIMNLIMTSTPLAMRDHYSFPFNDAATVIQWHVVGMFGPSFFTGSLIARMGATRIILAGVVINLICIAIALAGVTFFHFWWALLLLGIGWNFMYIGGTTLLTETYSLAEKAKAQAANDFLVFGGMVVASLSSGSILHMSGWATVLYFSLPVIVLAGLGALILELRRERHVKI